MSEANQGGEFLNQRYPGLAKSEEVTQAAKHTEKLTGTKVPRDPDSLIQNYLDRFSEIIERPNQEDRTRGIAALKKMLIDRYVVRIEDIPESYWQAQMRIVRNRGQLGDWSDLSEKETLRIKQDHLAQTKEDQKGSIESWIDYLASDKSSYLPDYLKYWVFAGMLKLERYEKGQDGTPGRFPERPSGRQRSVKMFPEINENGLKFIALAYKTQAEGKSIYWGYNEDIPSSVRKPFEDVLKKRNFSEIYGWTQEYIPPITEEEMQITEGQWITYPQGSKGKDLSDTLTGKGTGWCIAGENIAQEYLNRGNLSVYYTRDKEGNFINPRLVIVSDYDRVTEVRGTAWEENVDDYIKATNIIGDKLKKLPGGDKFFETDADTKQLTGIERKMKLREKLTSEELTFLYELDRPIKYFGEKKDPRIQELKAKRNPKEDMPIVFSCEPSQIAHNLSEIRAGTKAYVGPLEPGIFDKLASANVENIYTSFPEGKILRKSIEIGEKTKEQLQLELGETHINITMPTQQIILSPDFTTLPVKKMVNTVKLKVQDLGLSGKPTIHQIYKRAQELGLELCPAEMGPQYRLQYTDQPKGDSLYIGMKPTTNFDDYSSFFVLSCWENELWLEGVWIKDQLSLNDELVFIIPKKTKNP